ncbi:hypothetical protein GC177_02165 [bacterium]|nr:hypothetical protein [bacterium]
MTVGHDFTLTDKECEIASALGRNSNDNTPVILTMMLLLKNAAPLFYEALMELSDEYIEQDTDSQAYNVMDSERLRSLFAECGIDIEGMLRDWQWKQETASVLLGYTPVQLAPTPRDHLNHSLHGLTGAVQALYKNSESGQTLNAENILLGDEKTLGDTLPDLLAQNERHIGGFALTRFEPGTAKLVDAAIVQQESPAFYRV